ncbi:OLC1v1030710C1 [Oldenlandia corymbosa var. corymbosa]|uniref:OLC1v1030710C1 n=1 Tax=Oldenlandia corymbosa var. corymbosa TaxID=529605 RepID=A0AAV1CGL8_OLDCO|nr:OLC1v1030710C1 [Oldenlandia corymbosa var. corymbosa]
MYITSLEPRSSIVTQKTEVSAAVVDAPLELWCRLRRRSSQGSRGESSKRSLDIENSDTPPRPPVLENWSPRKNRTSNRGGGAASPVSVGEVQDSSSRLDCCSVFWLEVDWTNTEAQAVLQLEMGSKSLSG